MLELRPETSKNIVAITASGVLTAADQDAIFPKLEEILEQQRGSFRAFIDQTELTEIEKGVKSDALWFDMMYWPRVERMAIVGTKIWNDEIARLADIYKNAEVRRFEPDKREAAWSWLRS